LFVTVDNKHELQAISTSSGAILAKLPIPIGVSGTPPLELAISPDGTRAYVFAPQDQPNSLLVAVDTTTFQIAASASLPFNQSLGPMLVSPDGKHLYFEEGLVNQFIQVIDAATLSSTAQIPVNVSPAGIAITPSGLILLTDTSNELLVIDPQSATIVHRYSLSTQTQILTGPVISSPDGTTAYISFGGPSLLAVNIATGAVIFDAPVTYTASQFAISPDGQSLYSINISGNAATPTVSKFSISARKAVAIALQIGPLSGLALSPDAATLYVLNADVSAVVPVDVSSQAPRRPVLAGVGLNSLAVPPGGGSVWASSYAFTPSGDILVLDPATGQLEFISGPTGGLSFAPDGTKLYVTSPAQLLVLALPSLKPIIAIPAANLSNFGQAIPSPDGKRLYVSVTFVSGSPVRAGSVLLPPGEVVVFDTATFKRLGVITIPDGLGAIALTQDGSALACTSNFGHVHLISTATNAITATIKLSPANGALEGLAVSADGSKAYATDAVNSLLFVASLATHTQTAAIPVGSNPLAVAVTLDASAAWVATGEGLEVVSFPSGQVSAPVPLPGTPSAIVFAP